MKKFLALVLIFLIANHCSFDNKSGIWNDENQKPSRNPIDIGKLEKNDEYLEDCKWATFRDKCKKKKLIDMQILRMYFLTIKNSTSKKMLHQIYNQ